MSETTMRASRTSQQEAVEAIDVAIDLCWHAYHYVLRAHELGAESAALRAESTQVRRCAAEAGARGFGAPPAAARLAAPMQDSALTPR
jgi:hypothetical protein